MGRESSSRLVFNSLRDRVCGRFSAKYPGVLREDIEDCFDEAVARFVEGSKDRQISDPQSYIWSSTANAITDFLRRKESESQALRQHLGLSGIRPVAQKDEHTDEEVGLVDRQSAQPDFARFLVESLVEEVEADEAWAVDVVRVAVARLPPQLRRVMSHLLLVGFDYNSSHAPKDLGMRPVTFRANRSRAQTVLKSLIPAVMQEKGVVAEWISGAVISVFEERPEPSAEIGES